MKVALGEVLTERQAARGPTGAFGQQPGRHAGPVGRRQRSPAFVAKMNLTARSSSGMDQTHYADPSGYPAALASTPATSLKVAAQAMADPTFAEIVNHPSVTLPVAGRG